MKYVLFLLIMISMVLTGAVPITAMGSSPAKVQCINPDELKQLMDSNNPNFLVVDTQPKSAYDLGHIKGAVNFPWAMDIGSPGNLPKDKTLILYCDCSAEEYSGDLLGELNGKSGSCPTVDDSTDVAQQLMDKFGYKNVKILAGGWSKWKQLGYPIEKSMK